MIYLPLNNYKINRHYLMNTTTFKKYTVYTFAMGILLTSCTSQPKETPNPASGSWAIVQNQILTPSCATSSCHASDKDATYKEHNLILEASVAYKNLLNVPTTNKSAQNDGFLRIKPFKSLESLLYHKLSFDLAHHGGKTYGAPMPLGGTPLTKGQIEFVRRWIEAGAPQTGDVVDTKILDDTTPSVTSDFIPLDPPAAGQGFQLKVDKFEIKPNFERELFVRRPVGNTADVYVNRIQLKSRTNSHHMVIYDFRDKTNLPSINTVRDLRNDNGTLNLATALQMSNHIFMGGGTEANSDYTLPEGTALLFPANASVDLNPHYFNKTPNLTLFGENYVNLYTTDKAKVQHIVKMLDLNNTNITLPANQKTTLTKSFTFNEGATIVMLTSHTHKLGEKFVIKIKGGTRDGEVVYETNDWEHPLVLTFTNPLVLKKGEGLTSVVTYNNTSNKSISFGLTSEDEMDIIFGYYY
jgi:Copper type II ascorbate-dependent monooxygenase, C-terminal domain